VKTSPAAASYACHGKVQNRVGNDPDLSANNP
jgi:hypothetical protein